MTCGTSITNETKHAFNSEKI